MSSLMQEDIVVSAMAEKHTNLNQWLLMNFAISLNLYIVNILRKVLLSYLECPAFRVGHR